MTRSRTTETQRSISRWAIETFGPVASNLGVATRANEEMAELLRLVARGGESAQIAQEAADVVIVLARLSDRLGGELVWTNLRPHSSATSAHRVARANAALSRAIELLASGSSKPAFPHLQNAVSHLRWLATELEFDLPSAVDAKMGLYRARVWRLDGTGHGYHVHHVHHVHHVSMHEGEAS